MNAPDTQGFREIAFGNLGVNVERRKDGAIVVTPDTPLPAYAPTMCDCLEARAREMPDKLFIAQRQAGVEGWDGLTYGETLNKVRRLAQGLLGYDLSVERPLVILSPNSIDHLLMTLAAQYIGVPSSSISPAYSLISTDFGKLKHIFNLITPGLVFVEDSPKFGNALDAVWPQDAPVIVSGEPIASRNCISLETLGQTEPSQAVSAARASVGPETIAKFMLTSGSTGGPKAVITTQRMLTSNQEMIRNVFAFVKDGPVILDWLPWNHTFGGNHNVGMVLYNGGTFYIDDGLPTPAKIEATIRNLREIAPTIYFNVPKGFEELVPHLRKDAALRENFFSRLQSLFFAGAGLAPHVWQALDDLSVASVGARVPMLTGLGATETAPFSLSCSPSNAASGRVGLPAPGNTLKLVPVGDKLEARILGPNVTPGYWRQSEKTAAAFDEEGYYCLGDALTFVDENDINLGFHFDGRISEDFKLASGTWVSVGPLRARAISHCAPLVRDVVFAEINRDYLTALFIMDTEACAELTDDLTVKSPYGDIVRHPAVRAAMQAHLDALAAIPGGSSQRIMRAILLDTPPDVDSGEITDKGSINQRAVLTRRASDVEALYADSPAEHVLVASIN